VLRLTLILFVQYFLIKRCCFKDEQFSSTGRKQTHIGPDLINGSSYLSPPHNNSATYNTDDWYTCLFNDDASISDQTVSNVTTIRVKPIGQDVERKWPWPNFRYYTNASTTTEGNINKTYQDSQSVRRDFEPGPSEYKAKVLPTSDYAVEKFASRTVTSLYRRLSASTG
jgi:hypothetical protein